MTLRVTALTIFPLKAARGIAVGEAHLEPRGFRDDRRWMIVDANARCLTQREMPALAQLVAEPTPRGLRLSLDGTAVEIARPGSDAPRLPVRIWRDDLVLPEALDGSAWLSQAFAEPLRLVAQPDDVHRSLDRFAEDGDEVSLADGFPVLVATTASLEAVREIAGGQVGMERFRPNLVVDGASPWAEDSWARLRVGGVELDLTKPCDRCRVTTVDQARGVFDGEEPLPALRTMRLSGDGRVPGVLFGWNAIPRRLGVVRIGDAVEVLQTREPWPIRTARTTG